MCQYINNNLNASSIGEYVGGNKTNNFYISMFQDKEREFIVTHNANIRSVSYFTGRETELHDLRQKIEEKCKAVLVSGMGGIGKTHICRKLFEEYYKKHKDGDEFFRYIGYIEYDGDMGSSLQKCLKYKEQEQPEANQEAAWRELEYLASDGKLLLFIDNVNVSIGSDSGLEKLKKIPGAIILTSRRRTFSKEFEPYRIGFLSMKQCKELYKKIQIINDGKIVKDEEESDLEYVIEELAAKHTITIEFLAHLASTKSWTVKKLRRELEDNGFQLEYINEEDNLINIQNSYEKLYNLSELTEAEQNILEAFSVFPYIPLSVEICNQWLLSDAGVEENEDIFMGLYRKGWMQFDVEQENYTLHPVFAQFIYTKCKPNMENHLGLIESCQQSLKISENGFNLSPKKYIPFAENIIEKMKMKEGKEQISFIVTLAYLLYYIGEYKKAEELYKRSIHISKRVLGEEHPNTVDNYYNLARVYESQGEYGKARKLYEKSLHISEKVLGGEHLDTARSYNNLALVYQIQGEYGKAKELYEKSLHIREKVLGEEHPDTATSYHNLAFLYMSQGEYGKAKELYEKSLRIREKVLGREHPDTVTSYRNLAFLYGDQREYGKAKKIYEKSFRICKKALEKTETSYDNLAFLYMSQRGYGKVKELYEETLYISKSVLGEEHPDIASNYNSLGRVYESQGEYEKAKELYKKSLCICKSVLGEEHPDTAISYNNLAEVYERQGEYEKAKKLYRISLQIRESVLGEKHPDTASSYNNLAGVYKSQEEYGKAEKLYKKSVYIFEEVFGEKHPDTASSYNNLAEVYEHQGEYEKAEKLYTISLLIRENVLGEKHPDTATSYNNLAGVYYSQEKYGEAKKFYEKSIRIRKNLLGGENPDTVTSYYNLAGAYINQGEYEKALAYLLKVYKILIYKLGVKHPYIQIVYENMEVTYSEWNPEGNFIQWIDEKMKELS